MVEPRFFPAYAAGHLLWDGHNPYHAVALDTFITRQALPRVASDIPGNTPFWIWVNQIYALLHLPPYLAAAFWFVISCIATISGLLVTERVLRTLRPDQSSRARELVILSGLCFILLYTNLYYGQTSTVVFFLIAAAILFTIRGRGTRAALLFALAGSIKIFPIAGLGYFVLMRQWRAVLVGIAAFTLLQAPAMAQRPQIVQESWNAITTFSRRTTGSTGVYIANQSVRGFVLRLTTDNRWSVHLETPHTNAIYYAVALIMFAVTAVSCAWHVSRNTHDIFRKFTSIVVVSSLCAPFLWHHAYVILLPAFLYLSFLHPGLGISCFALVQVQHVYDILQHPPLGMEPVRINPSQ